MLISKRRTSLISPGAHPGPPPARTTAGSAIDYSAIREAVDREFACDHRDTDLCYKASVRGVRTYWNQCRECGQGVSIVKHADLTESDRSNTSEFDVEAESSRSKARVERQQELYREAVNRHDNAEATAWNDWYGLYLKSNEWRARRLAALARDKGICRGCLEATATQIHHLNYEHVGYELLFELVSVCDACHRRIHPDKT